MQYPSWRSLGTFGVRSASPFDAIIGRAVGRSICQKFVTDRIFSNRLNSRPLEDQRPVEKRPHPHGIQKSQGDEVKTKLLPVPSPLSVPTQNYKCRIHRQQISRCPKQWTSGIHQHLQNHSESEQLVFNPYLATQAENSYQ